MLTALRSQARSWIAKLLFGLLIVAFAVWGIGDIFNKPQVSQPIIRIGDDFAYSASDFDREMRLALQRLAQIQGVPVSPELFAQFGGAQGLVDQAESKGLLQVYGRRLGFEVPLRAAVQYVESDPQFLNATNRFDRARFEYFLRQMGQGEEQYVASQQALLRASYLMSAVSGPAVAPAPLVRNVHAYDAEKRQAETVLVPIAAITDVAAPDDATLAAWHGEQAARYQSPEYRAGLVVQMAPSDFTQDVAIPDAEIEAEYQARIAEYSTPETRNVEQVVVQDPAVAEKIITAVKGGTAFAQAVRDAVQSDPVPLGQVTKERLPADIADAVFALPAGSVSEALKSPFGLHVVFVSAVTPAATKPLADVRGEIRNALAIGRAADAMESVRVQLEDELAAGVSLAEAAEKLGLPATKFAAIDAAGQDRDGANLGLSADAVALIFETEIGEPGYVKALNDGSYAVAQIDEIIPPALRPLAEVRDKVLADWTLAQQRNRAKAIADEIAQKVKDGADLKTEAEARGFELKSTKLFQRDEGDASNGVTAPIARALFQLKQGEVTVGDNADGAVVARLAAIETADTAAGADADALKQAADRETQALASDIRQSFIAALRAELPVERNDAIWQRAVQSEN
jgi:peptidyl-prolyl cis-trans isomerase D